MAFPTSKHALLSRLATVAALGSIFVGCGSDTTDGPHGPTGTTSIAQVCAEAVVDGIPTVTLDIGLS
ncbi:MAG TPA: hypothetical protein ENK57_18225, partial [Polyangiaceae bacterium]|nr:hypothetical protein [Polyangiaceae bacterium]